MADTLNTLDDDTLTGGALGGAPEECVDDRSWEDEDDEGLTLDEDGDEVWVDEGDGEEPDEDPAAPVRRPSPPPGFLRLIWKTKKHESGMSVRVCPQCEATGSAWVGGGYTDPKAQALADALKDEDGFGVTSSEAWANDEAGVGGECLRDHWSRYGTGYCMSCNVQFWHDFVGNCSTSKQQWHHYYKPTKGQLGLF